MKNIAAMITTIMLGVLLLLVVLSLAGRMNRSAELESNLASVVEETVENMALDPKYEIHNEKEFLSDFTEHLSARLDASAEVCVEIEKAGEKEGILSVKVTETFLHPNGKSGTVSCHRTVILEKCREEEAQEIAITFYSSKEEMEKGGICYKSYRIKKGSRILSPLPPEKAGKTFDGWRDAAGNRADLSAAVKQDSSYYAAWK